MTPPMDRSGFWLLVFLAAFAFAAVAFIVVRTGEAGPIMPSPPPAVTTWPSGIGQLGGRPDPTRRDVAPTTWRPPARPAPTTRTPARPSHTAVEPTTAPAAPTTRATPSWTATAAPETTGTGATTEPTRNLPTPSIGAPSGGTR